MNLKMDPAHVKRYRQIAMLLVRHGRGDLVRSAGMDAVLDDESAQGDPEAAARLADDLEAMGPTFVKLGQLMSSRVDLLSPPYIEALSRLQDDVAPFPFERGRGASSAPSCGCGSRRSSLPSSPSRSRRRPWARCTGRRCGTAVRSW